jgi:hypothetical protein
MSQDSGTNSATAAALQRKADEIQQGLNEIRRLQSTGRTQTLLVVVIIILMFVVFMYSTYSRIRGNFNDAAVQKAIDESTKQFLPKASERLSAAARNAAPVYRELAMQRMQQVGPEIASQARQRLEKVPEESAKAMYAQLDTTFKKVVDRVDPEVKEAFPSLTDDRKKAILESFHADVHDENEKIKAHVDKIYTNELVKLHGVMEKFDTTISPGQAKDQAERDFLHSLVMYVDYIITQPNATGPASEKAAPVKQAAAPATQASSK